MEGFKMMSSDLHKEILESLRNKQEEMVRTLEELTNIDSPSTDKAHIDRFSNMLAEKWEGNRSFGTYP
jgi:acetylornithine deacetylase/succinyl-diaminopimelate desuccinylase-like protein